MSRHPFLLSVWFVSSLSVVAIAPSAGAPSTDTETVITEGGAVQDPDWKTVKGTESRSWSSADGKFSVTGTLVAYAGNSIRIKTEEGRTVQIELNKLSGNDNRYVVQTLIGISGGQWSNDSSEGFGFDRSSTGASTIDWKTAQPVLLNVTSPSSLDPSVWNAMPPSKRRFRMKTTGRTRYVGSADSADGSALAWVLDNFFGKDSERTIIEFYRTDTGAQTGRFALPQGRNEMRSSNDIQLLDVDPVHKRILVDEKGFLSSECQIWKPEGNKLKLHKSWRLARQPDDPDSFFQESSGWFIDENHMAHRFSDRLVIWEIDSLKPQFSIETGNGHLVSSADRKHVRIHTVAGVFEVDLLAGKCLGVVRGTESSGGQHRQGQTVRYGNDIRGLQIFDSADHLMDEFYLPRGLSNSSFTWLDHETLIAIANRREVYIDVSRGILLAEVLDNSAPPARAGWIVEDEHEQEFFDSIYLAKYVEASSVKLEKPDLESIRRRIAHHEASCVELFKSGDRVTLQLNLADEPQWTELARQRLTELLEARGVEIVPDSPTVLEVSDKAYIREHNRFGLQSVAALQKQFGVAPGSSGATTEKAPASRGSGASAAQAALAPPELPGQSSPAPSGNAPSGNAPPGNVPPGSSSTPSSGPQLSPGIGGPRGLGEPIIKYRVLTYSLKLNMDSQVVWNYQATLGGPGTKILVLEDETFQQAVDRQAPQGDEFWNSLQLPKRIVSHPDGNPWYTAIRNQDGQLEEKRNGK